MDNPTPHATTDSKTPETPPAIVVRDNEVEDRFELFVDGAPAGLLDYRVQGNDYALTHTEIDPDFEGRGMGSQLISHALDQLRAGGNGIIPDCPFVLSYIQRHGEYLDLVPTRYRADFDLPAH
ncbi:putative GNAT family acetyltransferase [Nakamurella sp. UYEF19]|uniref:GNAT family N-acetyltransferase n=1 Tax=Nakamurella sp. UYEF19 TaxID=1756392 RepID=UPI0033918F1B